MILNEIKSNFKYDFGLSNEKKDENSPIQKKNGNV